MTKRETVMIMTILNAAFPSFYRGISQKDAEAACNLWAEMFADDPADQVAAAVKALIATQIDGFPPTIGAVKEQLRKLREPDGMTAQAAWSMVVKAAEGNLQWEELPTMVQKAIGSQSVLYEWQYMDADAFNSVVYSQFVKAFKVFNEREEAIAKLPTDVRQMITHVADGMRLIGDGGAK